MSSKSFEDTERGGVGGLLREPEVRPTGEEGDDQRADGDALFLGAADQLGVQVDGDSDQSFLALGHCAEHTTGDILPGPKKTRLAVSHHPAALAIGGHQ